MAKAGPPAAPGRCHSRYLCPLRFRTASRVSRMREHKSAARTDLRATGKYLSNLPSSRSAPHVTALPRHGRSALRLSGAILFAGADSASAHYERHGRRNYPPPSPDSLLGSHYPQETAHDPQETLPLPPGNTALVALRARGPLNGRRVRLG
jgi:hypothetical protein